MRHSVCVHVLVQKVLVEIQYRLSGCAVFLDVIS